MKIAIASDHVGIGMRKEITELLEGFGHEVVDFGSHDPDRADYPT